MVYAEVTLPKVKYLPSSVFEGVPVTLYNGKQIGVVVSVTRTANGDIRGVIRLKDEAAKLRVMRGGHDVSIGPIEVPRTGSRNG